MKNRFLYITTLMLVSAVFNGSQLIAASAGNNSDFSSIAPSSSIASSVSNSVNAGSGLPGPEPGTGDTGNSGDTGDSSESEGQDNSKDDKKNQE